MHQAAQTLQVSTPGRGLVEITGEVRRWAESHRIQLGLLTVFSRHTSAGLLIQENADPRVRTDLTAFLSRLVPDGDPLFEHVDEGPDDMAAHVRTALTHTHLSIPLVAGRLALGTWQGIFVFEHRRARHERQVVLHLAGQ